MIRHVSAVLEALILVLLGLGILWFALSDNYAVLMNVNFRWLTASGAALLLLLGMAALGSKHKPGFANVVIFGLMLVLVSIAKPYLPYADVMPQLDPGLEAGLWEQVDLETFPQKQLQDVCNKERDVLYNEGAAFTTIGVVKRLEPLDGHQSFALMTSFMYCCLADALAVGLRVPTDELDQLEDGQWIMISGRLAKEETEIKLPNFRFERAMLSSVLKDYYLKPEKIMTYSRVAQYPVMTAELSNAASSLFSHAVRTSGLWDELDGEGPFTVFVPVEKAIEDMENVPIDEMPPTLLKQFVSAHIVRGRFSTRDLMDVDELQTLAGGTIGVEQVNGSVKIGGSRILFSNKEVRNGVIHFIYPAIAPG